MPPYESMLVSHPCLGPPSRPLPDRVERLGAHLDELQTWCVRTRYPWPGWSGIASKERWALALAQYGLSRSIRAFTHDIAGWYSHVGMRRGGETWEAGAGGVLPFDVRDYLKRNIRVDVFWVRCTVLDDGSRPQEDAATRELNRLIGTGYDFWQLFRIAVKKLLALQMEVTDEVRALICSELQALAYRAPGCEIDLPLMMGTALWLWTPDHNAILWDRSEGSAIDYRGRLVP